MKFEWFVAKRYLRSPYRPAVLRLVTAFSVIGVAGPGGGSAEKPVGLVIFGLARRDGPCRTERHIFAGDRSAVRRTAVHHALGLLEAEARR